MLGPSVGTTFLRTLHDKQTCLGAQSSKDVRCKVVKHHGLGDVLFEPLDPRVPRVQGRMSIPFPADE